MSEPQQHAGAHEGEYRIARLRERLAGDDLAELGVQIEQRGAAVVLTGTVPTTTRRDEIVRLARDELAGFTVLADLAVACADAPERWEELP
ncbi:BON domain-containing protein [Streptomyces roseoviridis]|uniref:BON domain-containing protein n=1 Tax=Streptomyces roseoviridis TaxID=67361 RepID=UPI0031EE5911